MDEIDEMGDAGSQTNIHSRFKASQFVWRSKRPNHFVGKFYANSVFTTKLVLLENEESSILGQTAVLHLSERSVYKS